MIFTKYQFAVAAWIALFLGVAAATLSIWQHSNEWGYTAGVCAFMAMVFGMATTDNERR